MKLFLSTFLQMCVNDFSMHDDDDAYPCIYLICIDLRHLHLTPLSSVKYFLDDLS